MRTLADAYVVSSVCFEISGIIYKNRANSKDAQENSLCCQKKHADN